MIANLLGESLLWDAWVPVDNERTWVYGITYNPWRPITEQEKYEFDKAGQSRSAYRTSRVPTCRSAKKRND